MSLDETQLASELRLAVMRLARRLRQQAEGDLTPSLLSALSSVDRLGPLALGELAAAEGVQPPTMTRVAAGLAERGLVVREPDATDRRVARLRASAEGCRLLAEARARGDAYLSRGLRALAPAEREALARAVPLLEKLAEERG